MNIPHFYESKHLKTQWYNSQRLYESDLLLNNLGLLEIPQRFKGM